LAAGLGSVIGQPIPDLSLHLLDENQNPVAPGEPGEICVGGEGVARGYLNRLDLTCERFIAHPFSDDPEARLYRSGDLARALPNGDYEYLGRIDHQVKIHGFRIELGEIESVLNSHELIRESVVVVDEQAGEKRLIGYIVPSGKAPDISQLREFVGKRLPQYMVPARFMVLDKLPLTINGKVDRRALPSISQERPELRTEYIPPTTNNELTLAAIWESVLGIGKVGINDNFFELGGESIRSIQVLAKAQENGIRFSLQKLFQHPTISGLLQNLDDKVDDEIDLNPTPFARVSKLDQAKMPSDVIDAFPIGRLQNGMIYHSDLDLESAIFHDVFSFRLNLPYNEKVLKNAIARLADRHAIYRPSFHPNVFSEPLQLVHRSAQVPFSVEDLRNETEAGQRAKLIHWVEVEKRNRFDWSKAPLMRLHVQLYSENAFQFIVSFHHVIMDGWSLAMMLTELFQDYMALLENKESNITSPKVTYRDFVQLEERTSHSPVSQDYWKSKLEGAQVHTLPRWPHKPERHGHEQVRGPEIYYPESLLAKLREIAKSTGVPIRTVLLAAHCRVMNLLTGQSDIMTGLVANGRPQTPDGERLIGLFLNTLPFRLQVEGTWRDLIQQTFKGEQELIPHRRMPLADIQQMTGGNPLFETTFDFVQFHIYRDLPGYKDHTFLEDHYFEANNFNFFVTFMLDASARELQMHFDYNPNEFSKEQIKAICDYYTQTLNAIAANPDDSCKGLSLIPQPELGLIESWNQTETVIPAWTVPEKVSKIAANTPDKMACVFKDKEWTYAQLEDHANLIAAHISERGLGANDFVGIYLNRSLEMVAATLGVLKAGAAYIPLDPNYPAERLGFMIKDSGLKLILTDSATSPKFHENHSVQYLSINKLGDKLSKSENIGYSAENLAYVIYTSGSTGTPKGVQIPHGALTNFLASMQSQPGISADDRLLAVTTLSFDIAGLELWLPLVTGSTVVIADSEDAKDPAALSRLIEEQEITVLQATPVTWNALVESGWQGKSDLKALCGGEALNPALAQELVSRCGELWNMYGPTETTIWSTIEKVERDQLVTIGRPIANTEILILDADLHPVPVGSPGEIYIGGAGLAKGYLNRAELTREKFIPHPFRQNERLYRTGDLGRFLPDGRILCLGRTDNQVKIRGFRIELGEIEAALEEHDSVCKAVVSIREDESGINELLAYWQPVENSTTSAAELRKYLQDRLPNHMVPSAWMEVKEFVLTPSGKIDRKKLPAFVAAEQVASNDAVPETPFELEVADTWRSVLKVPEIGLHDDFFEVGGHSLAAMRIVGNLRSKYNVDITLARFFQQPTVQALAAQVENLVKSHYNSQEQNGASKIVDI
ncbi:MAG: amino acid adenylation domain-containing protein, partial [Verrucomicrobiota bacterium]